MSSIEFPKIFGLSAQQKAKIARVFRRRFWVGHRPCYLQLFRNPLENSSTTSACKERVQRAVSGLPCWTRRRAAIIVNNGNADYRCLAFPCRRLVVVAAVVFFALLASPFGSPRRRRAFLRRDVCREMQRPAPLPRNLHAYVVW